MITKGEIFMATRKKKVTEAKVKIQKESNDFTKRIEYVERGEDNFYFQYNGNTISSYYTLKYDHVYDFSKLSDKAKVKVISLYGEKTFVPLKQYEGRGGIITKSGRGIRDGMTSREIAKLDFTEIHPNAPKRKVVARQISFSASDKAAIKSQIQLGCPHEVREVIKEISESEYLQISKEQNSYTTIRKESEDWWKDLPIEDK